MYTLASAAHRVRLQTASELNSLQMLASSQQVQSYMRRPAVQAGDHFSASCAAEPPACAPGGGGGGGGVWCVSASAASWSGQGSAHAKPRRAASARCQQGHVSGQSLSCCMQTSARQQV